MVDGAIARGRTEFNVAEETLYGFVVPLPHGSVLTVTQEDMTEASVVVLLVTPEGRTGARLALSGPVAVAADAVTSLLAWWND